MSESETIVAELEKRIDQLSAEVDRLRRAGQALEDADERKNEFLAVLAHELRNPLAPLRNGIELLEATSGEGAASGTRTIVGMLKRQVGQLTRLVDDLLDVTRITHGRLKLDRRPVQLLRVLERAIETVGTVILDRQQQFIKTLPSPQVVIDADSERLQQAFVNLLSNTSRFAPAGSYVSLVTEAFDDEVVIRIRGDGDGIPEALMPDPAGQFSRAASGEPGRGIGLAVAHSLVDQHDGEVRLIPSPTGTGNVLVVRLPARIERGSSAEETDPGRTVAMPGATRKRVLIVDDNVDAAKSLEMLLNIAHHEVRTAHDPQGALQALERFDADVILLDIGLPGMDGFELAKVIRARPRSAGVVLAALTGYGKDRDRVLSAQAGFDAHFTKPVAYETLDYLLNPGTRPLQGSVEPRAA